MVGLDDEDIERIRSFANTPRYRRDPSNLLPDGDHDEEESRANAGNGPVEGDHETPH